MSDLKHLRARIKSVKSTQKITKAMQLVSATKFTKAKNLIHDSEDYIATLQNIMTNIASGDNLLDLDAGEKKFFLEASGKSHLLIIVTSERGLCGAFNFMILRQVKSDIVKLQNAGKQVKLMIIGKKGYDVLKGQYLEYIDSYFDFPKIHDENLSLQIKDKLLKMLENSEISSCQLYFNKCKNAMTQIPIKTQILPVKRLDELARDQLTYQYEGEGLVIKMINLYVGASVNYALLESRASEEGARMTAMDNATKNANELIDKLTLKLNKSRQDLITKDLIEIIAGAEAM